jgi:hypothetical protein
VKKENIERFEKLHIQIKDIYEELVYYLKFINQLIEDSNSFLGDRYKPFVDFERFQEDDIPFNSDVVLIVSQYIKCLEKYKFDNIERKSGSWYWVLSEGDEKIETSRPISAFTI